MSLKNLYSNLIAGRLPVGSGSAIRVVSNHAFALLGTNKLHVDVHITSGFVYFLAVESQWMGAYLDTPIPFADCFPGRSGYQGNGVYLLQSESYSAALIIEPGSVQFFCNDPDLLEDYLLGLDLPVFKVDQKNGQKLKSVPQAILGLSEQFSAWVQRISIATLAATAAVFVGIHAYSAISNRLNDQHLNVRAVENDLNATLEKISIQQPLAMQLSRIQRVSATVVRSGGWIESYTLKGQANERFEIVLPSWVSQDYLDQLGRDVVTDLRDMEGLLTVRKQGGKGK